MIQMLQDISPEDLHGVGKSVVVLARFAGEKLPIVPGFVINSTGFTGFLDFSELRNYYNNSVKQDKKSFKDLRIGFEVSEFPRELAEELKRSYAKISGFADVYVNIRGLILDKQGNEIKHRAFIEFDVKGEKHIQECIKKLYQEMVFEDEGLISSFFGDDLRIVVIVQRAMQSEASGILFTTDPITRSHTSLIIEAVYGLETVIEIDSVVPDYYKYDKQEEKIAEKHISSQNIMIVRQPGHSSSSLQKVKISEQWKNRQKIDDKHIITLAKTGKVIEEGLGVPQQIVWLYESGKIWINFIENVDKDELVITRKESDIQSMIDEQLKVIDHSNSSQGVMTAATDNENSIIKEVANEPDDIHKKVRTMEQDHTKTMPHIQKKQEPLLEARYHVGDTIAGEVCFDPSRCNERAVLVLSGDEELPADIRVGGFIVEDESELLAKRLAEYFKVPVVTGVPLAKKILKSGEVVQLDAQNGFIYETIPFSEQVGEIEMNFFSSNAPENDTGDVPKTPAVESQQEVKQYDSPAIKLETPHTVMNEAIATKEPQHKVHKVHEEKQQSHEPRKGSENINFALHMSDAHTIDLGGSSSFSLNPKRSEVSDQAPEQQVVSEQVEKTQPHDAPQVVIKEHVNQEPVAQSVDSERRDVSHLLNLIEEDGDFITNTKDSSEVGGMDQADQFDLWGKSLESIITASGTVPLTTAADSLENVIEDIETLKDSKEYSYDQEENFIAEHVLESEEEKNLSTGLFIPTAVKVYVNLINESLSKDFINYDGVVFAASFDVDLYFQYLEDILEKVRDKDVIAVSPPYEEVALEKFYEKIRDLRNNGFRNLSLVLPDYRNKKELIGFKKILSKVGLRRTSTFEIYANVSRTINVFRQQELEKKLVDGVYVDLFRLKMNMLGIDKMTASTKYVEGMKNLVAYIGGNIVSAEKYMVNVSGFEDPLQIAEHLQQFNFWAIAANKGEADELKQALSEYEKKHITMRMGNTSQKRIRRK